ncbi:MAG: hypothetical protein KJ583_06890 [Nanoarchaeota archaeon]|nr:hypothetical protein [Nanoarchaeota archaeon]MBU1270543.1 hypothetical protein [Nanoarchaeota archaeon]MBU1605011.1 hypothetical protein [Nanoarchaeota archaeon]MBU2443435.1 hypothetical protein [Nanoarchaeota archaeon]
MITDEEFEKRNFYFPTISIYEIANGFSDTYRDFRSENDQLKFLALGISKATKESDAKGLKILLNQYLSWAYYKYEDLIKLYPEEELVCYKKMLIAASMIDNGIKLSSKDINNIGPARLFVERNYLSQDNETADLYLMYEPQSNYLNVLLSEPFFKKYYGLSYKDPARILYDAAQIDDKKAIDAMIYYGADMNLNAEDFLFKLSTEADYGRCLEPLIHIHGILPPGETKRNLKKHFDELKSKYVSEGKVDQYISGILNVKN